MRRRNLLKALAAVAVRPAVVVAPAVAEVTWFLPAGIYVLRNGTFYGFAG